MFLTKRLHHAFQSLKLLAIQRFPGFAGNAFYVRRLFITKTSIRLYQDECAAYYQDKYAPLPRWKNTLAPSENSKRRTFPKKQQFLYTLRYPLHCSMDATRPTSGQRRKPALCKTSILSSLVDICPFLLSCKLCRDSRIRKRISTKRILLHQSRLLCCLTRRIFYIPSKWDNGQPSSPGQQLKKLHNIVHSKPLTKAVATDYKAISSLHCGFRSPLREKRFTQTTPCLPKLNLFSEKHCLKSLSIGGFQVNE